MESFTALVPQPEKGPNEAITSWSMARPWQLEKLNMARMFKENPGFDFLIECWDDDPALRIVIKKLMVRCPQWGFVVMDEVLMEWNRE